MANTNETVKNLTGTIKSFRYVKEYCQITVADATQALHSMLIGTKADYPWTEMLKLKDQKVEFALSDKEWKDQWGEIHSQYQFKGFAL